MEEMNFRKAPNRIPFLKEVALGTGAVVSSLSELLENRLKLASEISKCVCGVGRIFVTQGAPERIWDRVGLKDWKCSVHKGNRPQKPCRGWFIWIFIWIAICILIP